MAESLPFLRMADDSLLTRDEMFAEVRRAKGSLNEWLTSEEKADSIAFKSLITNKLRRSLLFDIWLDSSNFESLARPYYGQRYEFPLNYLVPWLEQSKVKESLLLRTSLLDKGKIFEETERLLKALSEKLGKKDFLFGTRPSEADVYLFAFLLIVLKASMKNQENRYIVCTFNNLVTYSERIYAAYFSPSGTPKKVKRVTGE